MSVQILKGRIDDADRVRYIKLDTGGDMFEVCNEKGVLFFGYGFDDPHRFALAKAKEEHVWDEIKADLKKNKSGQGVATAIVNQARWFFKDNGKTIWITFHNRQMYWCFMEAESSYLDKDTGKLFAKTVDGWHDAPIGGNKQDLMVNRLSGRLTKTAAYRKTICSVDSTTTKYVKRKLTGRKLDEVENAIQAQNALTNSLLPLIKLLPPDDFEILVELCFARSGWRRVGAVGSTQQLIDLDLELPVTGENAFVQVKSTANKSMFDYYLKIFREGEWNRMFWVQHTGDLPIAPERLHSSDGRRREVTVIGGDLLAAMTLGAGLVQWLIDRTA